MGSVIVTGASRGLGAAIARAVAADGHTVAVNYAHDEAGAARVVAAIRNEGGTAETFRFDVTDETAVSTGVAAIRAAMGPIDAVVCNAVGPHGNIPLEEQTWDDHLAQLRFSVKSPLIMLQTVVGEWKQRGEGSFVAIGSEVVDIGNAAFAHYVGGKAAMVGLVRSWASELGPFGIRVNLVAPGFIPVERHADVTQADFDAYAAHVPLRRMGKPEDIANMVALLTSTRGAFVTGQTIAVNGGRTLA